MTSAPWPALTHERRAWTVDESASRSSRRKHAGPYDAAVAPPIATADLLLPSSVLADVAEAEAAITRFDEHISTTLGGAIHEFAPLSAVLLRTESVSSSQIENLTVGARQVALAEIGEGTSRNVTIVASNVRTMEAAVRLADDLDLPALLRLHEVLLSGSDPAHAGRVREQQVWIGGSHAGPHRAAFVPPHHERVDAALADLFTYLRRDDVPALAHVAVAHAQFETIHPFTDGNGRTGRAIVHAYLAHRGITTRSTVPVSAGLLRDLDGYFGALDQYRLGNPEPIIRAFCDASRSAALRGRALVDALRTIRDTNRLRIRARSDSAAHAVNELLIGQPVVNVGYVTSTLGISQPAAHRAIDRLVTAEVLRETTQKARHRVWQSNEVLEVLDDFAAGIRRPSPQY